MMAASEWPQNKYGFVFIENRVWKRSASLKAEESIYYKMEMTMT